MEGGLDYSGQSREIFPAKKERNNFRFYIGSGICCQNSLCMQFVRSCTESSNGGDLPAIPAFFAFPALLATLLPCSRKPTIPHRRKTASTSFGRGAGHFGRI